jgi:hypothetical protein
MSYQHRNPLIDALGVIGTRNNNLVGQGIRLRTGTVIANQEDTTDVNLVGIRVGEAAGVDDDDLSEVVDYYDIPTLVEVDVDDVVFWLQTNTGFGLVLGKKI